MSWTDRFAAIGEVLNTTLFTISGTKISLATLLTVVLILAAGALVSVVLRKGMVRTLTRRGVREGTSRALARLLHYVLFIIAASIALQTLGVNLSALFAAGAVFAVALGFAMQNIVQNFVSGVILLVERSIKPGDVLEVEGQVVRVEAMRIRSTIVQTRDGEELVVPNSVLVQSSVKNFTLKDSTYRVRAAVGVVYSSDMELVERTLRQVAEAIPWRLAEHDPVVLLLEFGDNSVNWEVSVWVGDPWRARVLRSDLNRAIWHALKQQEIVIAFPQLDVHFDPPVLETLRSAGQRH